MKDRKKLITLIIAIVVAISSIFIYKGAIAPKLYDKYINTGINYLIDGQYEEAILAFDKAIKIESKTTEARVYQANAYVRNEEFDKAVEVLEEAQNIDITNEELLKEILEILNEIDADIAYEFLDRFIQAVGKDNISQEIKYILSSAYESPSEPVADPEPGNAIEEFKNNIIQPTDKSKLNSAISKADNLYNNSVEGSSEGQYKSGSKSTLLKSINEAKKVRDNISANQQEIDNIVNNLNKAIDKFNNSKIEKKEFTKEMAIQYVENQYWKAPEGYVYVAKDPGIENGLRYWYVLFGPPNAGALDSFIVYENGKIIKEELDW